MFEFQIFHILKKIWFVSEILPDYLRISNLSKKEAVKI